ncbi:MAG: aminodeoxychorismate synthase component I [Gammaproteobacteria bacterium]|jgi:para-aminobenzoate synthetase / 4-amino-4-deoxychorismate lyase|nr:aminodeoxychorismate synthase component I [Gammaproteobacteria bacterium]
MYYLDADELAERYATTLEMQPLKALIFDQDISGWLRFDDPVELLSATQPDQIRTVLEQVESRCQKGMYAVGYVCYEAAGGLDSDLVHHQICALPLVRFGIYKNPWEGGPDPTPSPVLELEPRTSRAEFGEAIHTIKDYLREGDSYQVNFTHRLQGACRQQPEAVFRRLVDAQPSRYAAMIDEDDHAICSVSPELFFELDGDVIRSEPMKGTRPRGRYSDEDEDLRNELARSAKDKAENLMIVDMIRNDLGRIATPGTVVVDEMFRVDRLPTVWQQVSSVSAKTTASFAEIFAALFPCASVTGAPKRRTMEIILELESSHRGVYTGAIGLVKPGRKARFSVAIRTLVLDKNRQSATYGVGGGIVWDSDEEEEWQESLVKGEVLRQQKVEFQLLETMRYEPGDGIWLLDLHLTRLRKSADYFGFQLSVDQIVRQLKSIRSEVPVRLRLLVSKEGGVEIEQHDLGSVPDVVRLKLAAEPVRRNDVFLFHKTTHRVVYTSALAAAGDCDDVILWNEEGELTETAISNLYLEIDGELFTPCVDAGLLAGTYRQMMLSDGKASEARLTKGDLDRAERIYISNSVRGLVPAILV